MRSSYLDKAMTLSTDGTLQVMHREDQLDVVASFLYDGVDTVQVLRVRVGIHRGD